MSKKMKNKSFEEVRHQSLALLSCCLVQKCFIIENWYKQNEDLWIDLYLPNLQMKYFYLAVSQLVRVFGDQSWFSELVDIIEWGNCYVNCNLMQIKFVIFNSLSAIRPTRGNKIALARKFLKLDLVNFHSTRQQILFVHWIIFCDLKIKIENFLKSSALLVTFWYASLEVFYSMLNLLHEKFVPITASMFIVGTIIRIIVF